MMRRGFWIAFWGSLSIWLTRTVLLPAAVRRARISALKGASPRYAELDWNYGMGARPISIIFDLRVGDGSGSVTTDGEALEAEVPLNDGGPGAYQIIAAATYRIIGIPRTIEYRFDGEVR